LTPISQPIPVRRDPAHVPGLVAACDGEMVRAAQAEKVPLVGSIADSDRP